MVKNQPPKWHGGHGSDRTQTCRSGASSSTTATTKTTKKKSTKSATEPKPKPPSISHGKWQWMQRVRAFAKSPSGSSKPMFFKPCSQITWAESELIKHGFYAQEKSVHKEFAHIPKAYCDCHTYELRKGWYEYRHWDFTCYIVSGVLMLQTTVM